MYNKCPIIVTPGQDGNYLAIESWCIPHIYIYCNNKLLNPSKSNGISTVKLLDETVDELSRVLVLLNPDFSTAWNRRKQLLVNGQLDPKQELYLSKLILKRKPKSPESITYRQFVIKKCFLDHLHSDALMKLLEDELVTALEIASSYRCNYYAWTYRSWLFEQIVSLTSQNEAFFNKELSQMHTWIEQNISDYSGYHYLHQIRLKQLTQNSQLINQVINDEMQFCQSLLTLYPTQEALNLHRKFCIRLAKLTGVRGKIPNCWHVQRSRALLVAPEESHLEHDLMTLNSKQAKLSGKRFIAHLQTK